MVSFIQKNIETLQIKCVCLFAFLSPRVNWVNKSSLTKPINTTLIGVLKKISCEKKYSFVYFFGSIKTLVHFFPLMGGVDWSIFYRFFLPS